MQANAIRATQCAAASSSASSPSSSSSSAVPIELYQYEICPFCNKVKAYLDFLGVEYTTVEVNPLTKGELSFTKEHKKVPVAKIGDTVVAESSVIIDEISAAIQGGKGVLVVKKPDASFFPPDTATWGEWADKKLAVMLYPNITRTYEESWECFGYTDHVTAWNLPTRMVTKAAGAVFMTLANGKIKSKYAIKDERAELKETLLVWTAELKNNDFLHGKKVTMPDLLVYGVLRSIEGLRTFDVIMGENPALRGWYTRVQQQMPKKR